MCYQCDVIRHPLLFMASKKNFRGKERIFDVIIYFFFVITEIKRTTHSLKKKPSCQDTEKNEKIKQNKLTNTK